MIRVVHVHPGSWSWSWFFSHSRIPDPRVKKAPDPWSATLLKSNISSSLSLQRRVHHHHRAAGGDQAGAVHHVQHCQVQYAPAQPHRRHRQEGAGEEGGGEEGDRHEDWLLIILLEIFLLFLFLLPPNLLSRDQGFWRPDVWHKILEGRWKAKTCL